MKTLKYAPLLLALSSTTFAAPPDATVQLAITGGITVGGVTYSSLDLEVSVLNKYVSVHGGMGAGTFTVPATGTCFMTETGGVFCNLQIDQDSFSLSLQANLSGTIIHKNSLGNISASSPVVLTSIF